MPTYKYIVTVIKEHTVNVEVTAESSTIAIQKAIDGTGVVSSESTKLKDVHILMEVH